MSKQEKRTGKRFVYTKGDIRVIVKAKDKAGDAKAKTDKK